MRQNNAVIFKCNFTINLLASEILAAKSQISTVSKKLRWPRRVTRLDPPSVSILSARGQQDSAGGRREKACAVNKISARGINYFNYGH